MLLVCAEVDGIDDDVVTAVTVAATDVHCVVNYHKLLQIHLTKQE